MTVISNRSPNQTTPSATIELQAQLAELKLKLKHAEELLVSSNDHFHNFLLTPRVFGTPDARLRLLLLGTCQVDHLAAGAVEFGHSATHTFYSPSHIPFEGMEVDPDRVDAIVVGLTLRHILHEAVGQSMDVVLARGSLTPEQTLDLVEGCAQVFERQLNSLKPITKEVPTFVMSLLEPTFNYLGDLVKVPLELRPRFFVRALNDRLETTLSQIHGFHFFDYNECINRVGSIHLRDDVVNHSTHASIIDDWYRSYDENRLVAGIANTDGFSVAPHLRCLHAVMFEKLANCLTILRQQRSIKLIIVDLDDTMWRGIAAEDDIQGWDRTEGWPLAFVEALLYFKRRGGLLAICSKNDSEPTTRKFREIWQDRITLEDFTSVKINWKPKSENVAEIIRETNLLPENVALVDDNPREVAEIGARFPEIRALTARHHDWRRVILRSPETQVALITSESGRRTEMVRATLQRDATREEMGREEWLESLNLQQRFDLVEVEGSLFGRSLELLNKTNQFNTTGARWSQQEFVAFLRSGGICVASSLKDRTVDSGVIGIALINSDEVVQIVLSCRAFGLGAEISIGSVATRLAQGAEEIARTVRARFVETGKNNTCHGYFERLGFRRNEAEGPLESDFPCPLPNWIQVTFGDGIASRLRPR